MTEEDIKVSDNPGGIPIEKPLTSAPAAPLEESDDSVDVDDSLKKPTDLQVAKGDDVLPDFTFPLREICIAIPGGNLRFNPVASLFASIVLWGLTIWCMVHPETAKDALVTARGRVTELFTWFYVGTNPMFMVRRKDVDEDCNKCSQASLAERRL